MKFLRKLHKWLGLIIGLQLLIWVTSGMLISWLDQNTVSGRGSQLPQAQAPVLSEFGSLVSPMNLLTIDAADIQSIRLSAANGVPLYLITTADRSITLDARSGKPYSISQDVAVDLAQASYAGSGPVTDAVFLGSGSNEAPKASGALWKVQFDDDIATRVYLSASDGNVLAHRNSRWRIVDFLLMLHFMDYSRDNSFNNPQIIAIAFATLWLTISGLLLIFYSFGRRDFTWLGSTGR